jgi:hypothetical protein
MNATDIALLGTIGIGAIAGTAAGIALENKVVDNARRDPTPLRMAAAIGTPILGAAAGVLGAAAGMVALAHGSHYNNMPLLCLGIGIGIGSTAFGISVLGTGAVHGVAALLRRD